MKLDEQIDPSHEMTEWESAVVTLISTARFGEIRRCKNCEAEHARTVAGEAMHDELYSACTARGK
jgi:hypothetical protein